MPHGDSMTGDIMQMTEKAVCTKCGREFYVLEAKKIIEGRYGIGTYNNWYPDHDICSDCARSLTRSDLEDGSEIAVIMSGAWEDDT